MVFRFSRLTTRDLESTSSLSKYAVDQNRATIRVTKFLVNFFSRSKIDRSRNESSRCNRICRKEDSLLRKYVIIIVGRVNTFKNWENKNEIKVFTREAPYPMLETNFEKVKRKIKMD